MFIEFMDGIVLMQQACNERQELATLVFAVTAVLIIACMVAAQSVSTDQPASAKAVRASFSKPPLYFVEN